MLKEAPLCSAPCELTQSLPGPKRAGLDPSVFVPITAPARWKHQPNLPCRPTYKQKPTVRWHIL
jgi:hypothetical protein